MNIKITNLINLGLYKDIAVYYDFKKEEFYGSHANKNNSFIFIGTPIVLLLIRSLSTLLNDLQLKFSCFITISVLAVIDLLALFLTKSICDSSRKKLQLEKIEMTQGILKTIRLKSLFIRIIEIIFGITFLITFMMYLSSSDFQILIMYTFATTILVYIRYDCQLGKRKVIFKKYLKNDRNF